MAGGRTAGAFLLVASLPVMGSAAPAQSQTQARGQGACDRACLIKLTDTYVAALARHDPDAVRLPPICASSRM